MIVNLRQVRMLAIGIALAFVGGCSKKAPPEANAALAGALDALAQGNPQKFVSLVVPGQQAGVTKLEQWPFFVAIKSHEIDNEFDTNVTDTTATLVCSIYFDSAKEVFSTFHFSMKRDGDKWYLDLADTIGKQIAANGPAAFEKYKFVQKPGR